MRHLKQLRRRSELEQYAWSNRQKLTPSEAQLWEALRGAKLGVAFRRQAVLLDRYIVDFYAPSLRVVIEVAAITTACGRALMRGAIASCDERGTRWCGYVSDVGRHPPPRQR